MVLSLFAKRTTFSAIVSVAARTTYPVVFFAATRRALFTTPRLSFPLAEAFEEATKETKHETPGKKATRTASHKAKNSPKEPTEEEQEQTQGLKRRVYIPNHLKPPKRAPGPYFLFYSSFIRTQPHPGTVEGFRELCKRASEIWRGYSAAEKQPFYDENESRKAQAKQERDEFFRNTSRSDLKRLNVLREAQGKCKVHSKRTATPLAPFVLFANEFRSGPDGQAIINELPPGRYSMNQVLIAAADRWKSMSTEEKAPYFENFRRAKEELKSEQVES